MNKTPDSGDMVNHFIFDNADIRGQVVSLNQSYQQALAVQTLPPIAAQLLGEFLAAASLLAGTLKFAGTLALQAQGKGAIPLMFAECTHKGNLRGTVQVANNNHSCHQSNLKHQDFRQLLGEGLLSITINPEQGERYQGIVPLEGETLADCIGHYFQQSEQLPTQLWLASNNQGCAGLLLQALPTPQQASANENREHWQTVIHLAQTLEADELLNLEHSNLLYRLFNQMPVRLFEPKAMQFSCSCSAERSSQALISLGEYEAMQLLAEQAIITIDCQFCGQQYQYNQRDLMTLFGRDQSSLH